MKAAVLPLPVTALPQMSRPASARGMHAACRGGGQQQARAVSEMGMVRAPFWQS